MLFTNYLGNQITVEEIGGHAAYMGQMKNESSQETSREETTCKA